MAKPSDEHSITRDANWLRYGDRVGASFVRNEYAYRYVYACVRECLFHFFALFSSVL